jgi:hypothetical protein
MGNQSTNNHQIENHRRQATEAQQASRENCISVLESWASIASRL